MATSESRSRKNRGPRPTEAAADEEERGIFDVSAFFPTGRGVPVLFN